MRVEILGPWCAFASSVTWAVGSSSYAKLSKSHSAFAINFTRALVALPLFVLMTFLVSGGFSEGISQFQSLRWDHWGWFTLSMTASYGLGDIFFLWSTRSLGVPGALAIASCHPVWTVTVGYFCANEKVEPIQWIGLAVSLLGVLIVILNGPKIKKRKLPVLSSDFSEMLLDDITEEGSEAALKPEFSKDGLVIRETKPNFRDAPDSGSEALSQKQKIPYRGLILALLASIAWATNTFSVSRGGADVLASVANTARMLAALFLCASFGRILAPSSSLFLPYSVLKKSMWLFILEAFGGSCFYVYGLSHSPLALGSTLASLAPVISVPVALALGLERFSLLRTLGVCLAGLGIGLLVN